MNQYIKQILILVIGSVLCGYLLFNSYSEYVNNQSQFEVQIKELAERIRTNELVLSTEKFADLLVVTSERNMEKAIVYFYVKLTIISTAFSLLIYTMGFYFGKKQANKNAK